MSRNKGRFEKLFLSLLLPALLLPLTADIALGLDPPKDDYATVVQIPLEALMHDVGTATAQKCYTIEVPVPGLLALELSVMGTGGVESRLGGFELLSGLSDAERAPFDILERLATHQLLAIRNPGTYGFCISAQDPEASLEGSKLTNLFLADLTTKDGDPREEEPDPDLLRLDPTVALDSIPYDRLDAACRAIAEDDHGDTFLCATQLQLGGEIEGEIWNVWGNDEDTFILRLEQLTTVRLEAATDSVAFGGLYDRYRHQLHVEMRVDSANWRLVKTLAPGRYAVRLTGHDGLSGSYRLSAEAVNR